MTHDSLRPRIAPVLCAFMMVGAAVLALAPSDAQTQGVDPVPLEWWDETDIGDGFHLRIPVTVTNHRDFDVENGAVFAELDITHKLIEAGWVSQARSDDDLLRLFELDEASVRVVAMTDLDPMTSDSIHGRLGLYTRQFEPGDLRRHEVPSTYFEGFLSDADAPDFKATTNPAITVLWRVPGVMEPEEERHFMVYFDSTTNAQPADDVHAPPDHRGVEGFDLLERSFWSGPGMDLVGFVTPGTSRAGIATVIGLYDDTEVKVYTARDDGSFALQGSASTHSNPFTIDAEEFKQIFISNTYGTPFRVVADKPILALVDSEGFVPAPSGRMQAQQGESFLFSTTQPAALDQDGLHFFNLNPDADNNPACVRLRSTDGSTDRMIILGGAGGDCPGGASNSFPYTIGPHAVLDANCNSPIDDGRMAPVPPGSGDYRAEVVSGGPVALLYGPASGVTQVPAIDGNPTGTEFRTATSKTNCNGVTQQNHFYAISDGPADLGVYPPHRNAAPQARLFPSCQEEPCGEGQSIGSLPNAAFLRSPFAGLDGIPDRPAIVRTDAPTWLMTGPAPTPPSLDAVPLRGPLGGADAATVFNGFGSTVSGRSEPAYIYSPFGDTRVVADIHYTASEPATDLVINLLEERVKTLPTRTGDPIRSYHLESDRPIVVLPRGAAPGFLAGMPVTLQTTVHPADYRGHLIDIRSTTGLNPVSASTIAGEPVTYTFEVTNLGREAGAESLSDKVTMKVTGAPNGWTTDLSPKSFKLVSGQTELVRLKVTPPSNAETDTLTPMHVHALSQSGIGHSVEVDTFIKSDYGVGIWFDGINGGNFLEKSAARGTPINYTVFVQNLGSVTDTIQLDVTPKDWDARLLQGGVPVGSVSLAPSPKDGTPPEQNPSVAILKLQVTPPVGGADGLLQTTVTATSLGSPGEKDKVFAISKVNAPSDLSLTVDDQTVWVTPGGTAQFNFSVRNDGQGGTEAFFDLRPDLLPGWGDPKILFRSPQTGHLSPLSSDPPKISVGENGNIVPLAVTIDAAQGAMAGDQVAVRLGVTASDAEEGLEAFLLAVVPPVHDIEVIPPDGTLRIRTGGLTVPVELRINNSGNLDETLVPVAASLPPGWDFTFPADEVFLPRGVTQVLDIGVRAPPGVEEGAYEVTLALVSNDGARTEVTIPVEVGTFAGFASYGSGQMLAQPGQTVWTEHDIRNDGNTLLEASIEAASGEPWDLAMSGGPFLIPAGANVTIPVGWKVPVNAPDATGTHSATVVMQPESLSANTVRETVQAQVAVGRSDLRFVDASTFDGPAGQVVQATVANDGDRPAYGAVVQLRAGTDAVDQVVFGVIAPGDERPVTLLRPEGYDGDSVLVMDPDGVVVESSESNNLLNVDTLELDGSSVATPSPGFIAALAMVLLASALRRPPIGPTRSDSGHAMAGTTPQNGPAKAGNHPKSLPNSNGSNGRCRRSRSPNGWGRLQPKEWMLAPSVHGRFLAAVALVVMLMFPTVAAGLPGDTGAASETVDEIQDAVPSSEEVRRLLSHLPDGTNPFDALGPAAHWVMDPDTGGLAEAPKDLDDLFGHLRQEIPWEPLPIPDVPEGPEPLLSALGEYADVAGVELPDVVALRAQIASLRMQPEAEEALSRLVRAYNQALQLEEQATEDLTPHEERLMVRETEAVRDWFDADPDRTQADLDALSDSLMAKVDMGDRLQATDLLLRTTEAIKDIISLPPVPLVPDAVDVDTDVAPDLPQWPGTGDPAWDKLHHLVSFGTTQPPTALPELPVLDLQSALTLFAAALGQPVEEPIPLGSLADLPPSMSQAVSGIVTARAAGLMIGDPTLHTRWVLEATREAEPTLQAWAAVQDMQRTLHTDTATPGMDVAALLEATLAPGAVSPFAAASGHSTDIDVPEPPRLAKLLRNEGLSRSDARAAERSLPAPVALGTAYALDGMQRMQTARDDVFQVLGPLERDALTTQSDHVATLLETSDWTPEDAALVQAWATGLQRIGPDGLETLRAVQLDALASIEAGAAVLAAYSASIVPPPATPIETPDLTGPLDQDATDPAEIPVSGDDDSTRSPVILPETPDDDAIDASPGPIQSPTEDDETVTQEDASWTEQAWTFVKDFQVIGTASAQTLPSLVTTCRDHAFSDCETNDVWFEAAGILITGFGSTTVGPGVTPSTPDLVIDLGGDDTYVFPVATASGTNAVRVAIDLDGDDTYDSGGSLGQGAADGPGTFAVLWDDAGKDTYIHDCTGSVCGAQGYGSGGGTGVLYDGGGVDTYEASKSRAHGTGWSFGSLGGTGVMLDRGVGDDALRASRGQGYAQGTGSTGILVNDGDRSANEYSTTNNLIPRYQGGRSVGGAATGVLIDLGGQGTTYSNIALPDSGDLTYRTHHDEEEEEGPPLRQDDALWLEHSITNGPGLGIDSSLADEDDDGYDNWVELLAGSDPGHPESTPEDSISLQDLIDTVVGLLPDPDDIPPPEELLDPDNLPDPEDIDPETVQGLLDGFAQSVDIGLCREPTFDDETGACEGTPMNLLHIGPSSDDTIEEPALILIELGGDDTYPVEVAGPGAFYIHNQGTQQLPHQRVDGIGSIAIDLGGDDTYQDSGGPTQGAVTESMSLTDTPSLGGSNAPVTVEDHSEYGFEDGTTGRYDQCPRIPLIILNQENAQQFLNAMQCYAPLWVEYATSQQPVLNDINLQLRNPYLPPMSLLLDLDGDDRYEAGARSQGSAFSSDCIPAESLIAGYMQFEGAAWLMDLNGSDAYTAGPDSQANVRNAGGQAGLIDLAGDDTYRFVTQGQSHITDPLVNLNAIARFIVCEATPYGPHTSVFYDGGGMDTYDNTGDAAPAVDPALLDFSRPPDDPVNDAAFRTQGIGRSIGTVTDYVGVFIDDGPELDTYLARGDAGPVDLSDLKNGALRAAQNGAESDGDGQGMGFFIDGATGVATPDDLDCDGAPGALETAAGTDPNDPDDHPGSVWMVQDCGDGTGPMLDIRSQDAPAVGGIQIPGLLVLGHEDAEVTVNQPFMVALGGNNTYTHPSIGGTKGVLRTSSSNPVVTTSGLVSLFVEAGHGDTDYLPSCTWSPKDIGVVTSNVKARDDADISIDDDIGYKILCASLGGAVNGVSVMVDNGGDNTFRTEGVGRIRTQDDWHFSLASQGAGIRSGIGALVTWNASNRFDADLSVEVRTAEQQSIGVPDIVVARAVVQGAGYDNGIGILANLESRDDQYSVHQDASSDAGIPTIQDVAQGSAVNAYLSSAVGLLLDTGGNNTFTASNPIAQGATLRSSPSGDPIGMLWSGTGNDHYQGGRFSQGAALGVPREATIGAQVVVVGVTVRTGERIGGSGDARVTHQGYGFGLLHDAGGHDQYVMVADGTAPTHGQGTGVFDTGILIDAAGDDRYLAPGATFVQGTGLDGVGALLDLGGNDEYEAGDQAQAYASDLRAIVRPTTQAEDVVAQSGFYEESSHEAKNDSSSSSQQFAIERYQAYMEHYFGYSPDLEDPGLGGLVPPSGGDPATSLFPETDDISNRAQDDADNRLATPPRVGDEPHNPTLALLVDLHGRDAYTLQGEGQGLTDVSASTDGVYQSIFLDAAGDDVYEHHGIKRMQHDLCQDAGTCLPDNDRVWTSHPVDDTRSLEENLTRMEGALQQALLESDAAAELMSATDRMVQETATDWEDGADEDEVQAFNAELEGLVQATQTYADAMDQWTQEAQAVAVEFSDAFAEYAESQQQNPPQEDIDTDDTEGSANRIQQRIMQAVALTDPLLLDTIELYNEARDIRATYGDAFAAHSAQSVRVTSAALDELVDRTFNLTVEVGDLHRAMTSPSLGRAEDSSQSAMEHFRVARDMGIDASTIADAVAQLYQTASIAVPPLQVTSASGPLSSGDTAEGELAIRVTVESSTADLDPDRIDRVVVTAENRVIGQAILNEVLTDNDTLVYDHAWNTTSTTFPERFPDGNYTLRASVYMHTGPGAGAAGAPDLPAAESEPFDLTIDNLPVIEGSLDGFLISAAGQSLTMDLLLGVDADWPDDLRDPGDQAALCDLWNVNPCRPGAEVTFTRTNVTGDTVTFLPGGASDPDNDDPTYLPAGHIQMPITATEGGDWKDGTYRIRLHAEDVRGQQTPELELPVITVDSTAPIATITTPTYANDVHSDLGGTALKLSIKAEDSDGSGVVMVCAFQLDAQNQVIPGPDQCKTPSGLTKSPPSFTLPDDNTFRFIVTAVDAAGNSDSPCHGHETVTEPHCTASKIENHTQTDPTIHTIVADFDAPTITNVKVDGNHPDEAYIRPGVPVNFTARVDDIGTGVVPPGKVQIQLPSFDEDGFIDADPFVDMQTDGQGHYWYDEWHLHNQDMHDVPRDDKLAFTILAIDRAVNTAQTSHGFTVDSLEPLVVPVKTIYLEDAGTDDEKELLAGRPGLLVRIQVQTAEAAMDTLRVNTTEVTGVPGSEPCGSGDLPTIRIQDWTCEFLLPAGLADGDYTVRFNATDMADNVNDDATATIQVRADKLGFANITVDAMTHDGFRVNWTTPFEGTSRVRYGEDQQLAQETSVVEGFRTQHSVQVTGLKPATPYFFHVVSTNTAGVTNNSTALPVPVTTLNAYTFDLGNISGGQNVSGLLELDYDFQFKAGVTPTPLDIEVAVRESGRDVTPHDLSYHSSLSSDGSCVFRKEPTTDPACTVDEGTGKIIMDTSEFVDGDHVIEFSMERGRDFDGMDVHSPVIRFDNTESIIGLVSPRIGSTVATGEPVFEVELQDLPIGQAPPLNETLSVQVGGQVFDTQDVTVVSNDVVGLKRYVSFKLPVTLSEGQQELNVSVVDAAGNMATAAWRFIVDSTPPVRGDGTEVAYVPGPDHGKRGGEADVTVFLVDAGTDVASVSLDLSVLSDDAGQVPMLRVGGGGWKATITIPDDAPDGVTEVPVTARDSLGNQGAAGTVSVSIDAVAPQVTSTTVHNTTYTSAVIDVATDEATRAWHGEDASMQEAWGTTHVLEVSGLAPGQEHDVVVHVVDTAGNNVSKTVVVDTVEDAKPPSNVTGLQATSPGEGAVMLSWVNATDNAGVASYRITRSDQSDNATTTAMNIHRDDAAPAGAEVTYGVAAVDVAGNTGPVTEVTIQVLALPHLFDALVTPMKGPSDEPFTFQVNYSHPLGVPADLVTVRVAGNTHILERVDPETDDCSAKCLYQVQVKLHAPFLFDERGDVVFKATTDGHQDTLTLPEGPLVLGDKKAIGVMYQTDTESKDTPLMGMVPMVIALLLAAIAFSHRRRHHP